MIAASDVGKIFPGGIEALAAVNLIGRMSAQLRVILDAYDDITPKERQAMRALIDEADEF